MTNRNDYYIIKLRLGKPNQSKTQPERRKQMQYISDVLVVSSVVSGVLALMAGVKYICNEYLRNKMNMMI